jgi:pimeloyl-ACP methyl ester carboxylesterase
MPFIKRRGKPTLHYRLDDYTDPWKNAGTVLLQHGYARSSVFCASWVPYLASAYRVVRPDLRGHGESPPDFDPATDSTLEGYVEDVLAVLDALEIATVHYCGESFGGIIGMALAAQHPQRVCTLTLVASPVYQSQKAQDSFAAGFPSRKQALRTLGVARWAQAIYGAPGFLPEETDPRLRDWYVAEIGRSDLEVLCGLYGLLRQASAQDFLPRIQAPVLGLYPTSGAITGGDQEALLIEGIKSLTLIHLPTRSHAILTLYPAECARHLLEFAKLHDDGAAGS